MPSRAGDAGRARAQLEVAQADLAALRARPHLLVCRQLLKALTSASAGAAGEPHLTPKELEVARLAAAGLTNRQVAERLFVSIKTVNCHLDHVYKKLGISRRSELSARLE